MTPAVRHLQDRAMEIPADAFASLAKLSHKRVGTSPEGILSLAGGRLRFDDLKQYSDVLRAREVSERETARKFGPAVAARIGAEPRYPLEKWEVDALTAGGPRPEVDVDAILEDALRSRGLGAIADRVVSVRH